MDKKEIEKYLGIQKFFATNEGKLVVTVKSLRRSEGKGKYKPDGEPIVDINGEQEKYEDTYYAELVGEGISIDQKLDLNMFNSLKIDEKYMFNYKLDVKSSTATSKAGNSYVKNVILIQPISFEEIAKVMETIKF